MVMYIIEIVFKHFFCLKYNNIIYINLCHKIKIIILIKGEQNYVTKRQKGGNNIRDLCSHWNMKI